MDGTLDRVRRDGFQVVYWHYNPSGSLAGARYGEWFESYQDAEAFVAGKIGRTRRHFTMSVHGCGKPVLAVSEALFCARGEA